MGANMHKAQSELAFETDPKHTSWIGPQKIQKLGQTTVLGYVKLRLKPDLAPNEATSTQGPYFLRKIQAEIEDYIILPVFSRFGLI